MASIKLVTTPIVVHNKRCGTGLSANNLSVLGLSGVNDLVKDSRGSRVGQIKDLFALGVPIMISMAALIGLGVTDTLMAGLASTDDLAALAVGTSIYYIPVMLLIGLTSIVAPRIAWQLAANRDDAVRHDCWQSMWLGLIIGGLCALGLFYFLSYLHWLKLNSSVQDIAHQYLLIVLFALPFIGVSQGIRSTIDGLGFPVLNMWVSVAALLLNLVLDYLLVFGKFGFPRLGALGCALATLLVVILQTIMPLLIAKYHRDIRRFDIFLKIQRPDFPTIKKLLVLGVPAAVAITLEEGFFTSTIFLVAPMGTTELATHQILLNIAMVALVFPIALGQAASILIGRALGLKNPATAETQSRVFLVVLVLLMVICGAAVYTGRTGLVSLFSEDAQVIALGAGLLVLISFQMLVDGLQIGSNIALKGYQDTLIPAMCQVISYWLIGFPLAWYLTKTDWFGLGGGISGVWIAMFVGLAVSAILGVSRLAYVSSEFRLHRRQLD